MARDIGTLQTELDKFSVRAATLIYLDWHTKDAGGVWRSTPLYLTSAGQNIVVAGTTYQAVGTLGTITGAQEGLELSAYSMTLNLSGIPGEFLPQLFNDVTFANAYTNRPAQVSIALLDDDYEVIESPILVFSGQMDSASISVEDTVAVQLTVHSRLINWEIPRGGRFNAESQRTRFPSDTGFSYIPTVMNTEIIWGPEGKPEDFDPGV